MTEVSVAAIQRGVKRTKIQVTIHAIVTIVIFDTMTLVVGAKDCFRAGKILSKYLLRFAWPFFI